MAKTTPEKVRSIAKHLASLSDDELNIVIDDAYMEVKGLKIKEEYEEQLNRYLAAHLASLNIRQAVSERVGDLSKTYAESEQSVGKGLESTPYGQEYKRLLALYGRPKLNLTVI